MRQLILLILWLPLAACETDNQYSSAYCSFVFQANLYPTSALTRAIGGTGGDFCIVKAVLENGVYHLKLNPNQGSYSKTDLDLTMMTAIGNERISYANMGHKQGLIIGRTYNGVLCAYDLQCPNCDNNYELKWGAKAQEVQCAKCHRIYDIYSEYSYIKSGDRGHALTQYRRVVYNQQNGRLIVNN